MQYWSIYEHQITHTHAASCIHAAEQRQPMLLSHSACHPSMQAAHWLLPLGNLHEKKEKQGKKAKAIGLLRLLIVFASERTSGSIDS